MIAEIHMNSRNKTTNRVSHKILDRIIINCAYELEYLANNLNKYAAALNKRNDTTHKVSFTLNIIPTTSVNSIITQIIDTTEKELISNSVMSFSSTGKWYQSDVADADFLGTDNNTQQPNVVDVVITDNVPTFAKYLVSKDKQE